VDQLLDLYGCLHLLQHLFRAKKTSLKVPSVKSLENCVTTKTYTAKATRTKYTACDIINFTVANVKWDINDTLITHAYPTKMDKVSLMPTIMLSPGAMVNPASYVEQDFFTDKGVTYTVTSESGINKIYTSRITHLPRASGEQTPSVNGLPRASGEQTPPVNGQPRASGEQTPPVNGLPQPSGEQTPPVNGLPQPSGEQTPPVNGLPQTSGERTPPVNGDFVVLMRLYFILLP
jgi:hypothetical protein